MKSVLVAAILGLTVAACSPGEEASVREAPGAAEVVEPSAASEPSAQSDSATLTPDGLGPLRIGMTRAEVEAAMGPDANPGAVGGPDPEACDEFRPANAPAGVLVMIERDSLTRISLIDRSPVATPEGLSVGATADEVKSAYGDQAVATPHKYVEAPAAYMTVWEGGPRGESYVQDEAARGIVYEVDRTGAVSAIRAGGPSIQYVEGCA